MGKVRSLPTKSSKKGRRHDLGGGGGYGKTKRGRSHRPVIATFANVIMSSSGDLEIGIAFAALRLAPFLPRDLLDRLIPASRYKSRQSLDKGLRHVDFRCHRSRPTELDAPAPLWSLGYSRVLPGATLTGSRSPIEIRTQNPLSRELNQANEWTSCLGGPEVPFLITAAHLRPVTYGSMDRTTLSPTPRYYLVILYSPDRCGGGVY
jgi:hypothetical protein